MHSKPLFYPFVKQNLKQEYLSFIPLQQIATLQRLVFDFMGYMWGSITANIVNLIVVIVGIVGAYQYRGKVLLLVKY